MLREITIKSDKQNKKRNVPVIKSTINSEYLSFLFQKNKEGNLFLFSIENKPTKDELILEKPSSFIERKLMNLSLSTKDTITSKEKNPQIAKKSMKKLKRFNTFYTTMKSVQQQYSHILKSNIEEKNVKSKLILSKIKMMTNHVHQWSGELKRNKELNKEIESSSFQLDTHLQRLHIENDINTNEIAELNSDIETMNNEIISLNRSTIEYVNKGDAIQILIDEMKRKIRRLPQDNNIIENQIRNVKAAIGIINKKNNETKIDLHKYNKQVRDFNLDIRHVKRMYEAAIN